MGQMYFLCSYLFVAWQLSYDRGVGLFVGTVDIWKEVELK